MLKRLLLLTLILVAISGQGMTAFAQENQVGGVPEEEKSLGQVGTWTGVTVMDVAGWKYENVSLWWVGDGRSLRMGRSDGAVRDFVPTDIATITSSDGRDLTAEVAAGMTAPGQPSFGTPRRGTSAPGQNEIGIVESAAPVSLAEIIAPRPFRVTVDLGLGYALPSGDWFRGTDSGINYSLGLRFSVSPKHYLRFLYRRQDLGEETLSYYDYYTDEMLPLNVGLSAQEFLFMFGFHSSFNHNAKAPSLTYCEIGPTAVRYQAEAPNDYYLNDESITKFAFAINLGVFVPLNSVLALDAGVNLVHKPGWVSETEPGGMLIGAHIGLSLYN